MALINSGAGGNLPVGTEGAVNMKTITAGSNLQSTELSRKTELEHILREHRLALILELHRKTREIQLEQPLGAVKIVQDEAENLEAKFQTEMEFALLQIKTETIEKINNALRSLDDGTYGLCHDCGDEIRGHRLRALPFATRCRNCQTAYETEIQRADRHEADTTSPSRRFDLQQ